MPAAVDISSLAVVLLLLPPTSYGNDPRQAGIFYSYSLQREWRAVQYALWHFLTLPSINLYVGEQGRVVGLSLIKAATHPGENRGREK